MGIEGIFVIQHIYGKTLIYPLIKYSQLEEWIYRREFTEEKKKSLKNASRNWEITPNIIHKII